MPCILKVRVHEARGLPIMDKRSESTDAYIEVHFGESEGKTRVVRCAAAVRILSQSGLTLV